MKKSIVYEILTPTFDGNILKVLHQDKRINGRTPGMRIQRSQNIKKTEQDPAFEVYDKQICKV